MFSKANLSAAVENAITAGLAAFAGSQFFTSPDLKSLYASLTAAGVAALYSLTKALGAKQATKG